MQVEDGGDYKGSIFMPQNITICLWKEKDRTDQKQERMKPFKVNTQR